MPIKASTKFSSFEYQALYAEPIFEPLRIYGSLNAVYRALKPWNIAAQNVTYEGGAKRPTDTLVTFDLALKHYTVSLALAGFTFKANFADWSQGPIITEIIAAISNALENALSVSLTDHTLTIIMQLALTGKSIRDLTIHLANPLALAEGEVSFYGFLLHTKDGVFVVDKSAADPNDLFVRIVRKKAGKIDMTETAKALLEDEMGLAQVLGIEIV